MQGSDLRGPYWHGRRVLVTGASGLLGSNLCAALTDAGAQVTALLRPGSDAQRLQLLRDRPGTKVVPVPLSDRDTLVSLLEEAAPSVVFHLAAMATLDLAERGPLEAFTANIAGTWNLLDACRLADCADAIAIASSIRAQRTLQAAATQQQVARTAATVYDASKACADLVSFSYFANFGLPVAVIRPGNFFGPGDLNFSRIIPGTIRAVLRNESPVIRGTGAEVLEFTYVGDVVQAFAGLARRLDRDDVQGRAFHISSGYRVSVLELVNTILRLSGRLDLKPVILARGTASTAPDTIDTGPAVETLQWQPATSLDTALGQTIAWYERHPLS